ncbi:alpha/beta hydrolase [Actinoplanes sp. NPDC051851]|uniref:alpha/beta hydrolase n=1 Tax=Actinoplanes sp. NPDC051851 TaxID=3154753 RepID=UPI00344956F5
MSDHFPPTGVATRGTVLIVPGRGETALTYARLGRRLAVDAYRVRVLPSSPVSPEDLDAALTGAVADLGELPHPLILIGADSGAALIAALLASADPSAVRSPDAVVLAGLPTHDRTGKGSWESELDLRTHCPAHRAVLTGDAAFSRGTLTEALPLPLLDVAYGSTSAIPHLLLAGVADPLTDHDALAGLAKTLPTARLSLVRDTHHDVLNDATHRSVAAEIITFLEAVRVGVPPRPFVTVTAGTW